MPTGIYIHKPKSESTKLKMSLAQKGRKLTDEHRVKLSFVHTGVLLSPYHREQIGKGGRGIKKPFSKEHCINISIANTGKIGELASHYIDGRTPENIKIRNSIEMKLWRDSCFARDGYTDQKTGIKGGKLTAHHIQNFSSYPELRFAIDNGITLSVESHRAFHKKYGIKNNTKEQLLEFLTTIR